MTTVTIRAATAGDHGTFARLVPELGVDDPVPTPERFAGEMIRTVIIAERDGRSEAQDGAGGGHARILPPRVVTCDERP